MSRDRVSRDRGVAVTAARLTAVSAVGLAVGLALAAPAASEPSDHCGGSAAATGSIASSEGGEIALTPISPEVAAATFARLKAMAGSWEGVSTKGWTEEMTYTTIARESCVLERSFDAHPNETMLTLYHVDGDRLLLTHYCVAQNQPRLAATAASADGSVVEFTFEEATGIASRDQGHMDRLVMCFAGDGTVVKQWYWYANGAETPMEAITLTRLDG